MSEVNLGLIDLCTLCIMKQMSLKDAAESLNTSVSTLQRKLKREGTTYSDLKLKVMPDTSQQQTTAPMLGSSNSRTATASAAYGGATPPPRSTRTHSVSSGGDDSSHSNGGGAHGDIILSPKLQRLLAIAPQVKDIPSWLGPMVIKELEQDEEIKKEDPLYYRRPDWLYPHQETWINLIKQGNGFCYGMRQLTGKTTATHVADLEMKWENAGWRTHCMTTSIELSKTLFIGKLETNPLEDLFKPFFKSYLKESYSLINKSLTQIFPMKVTAIQGPTANCIWIDEIDKVIAEPGGRETLAGLFPQLLKSMVEGKGHLWITCNLGTTRQFHAFMHELEKLGYPFFPVCEIVEPVGDIPRHIKIRNKHIPSPDIYNMSAAQKEEFFKQFMYDMLKALAGEQFAKAMILNEEDWSKDPFNPALIEKVFEPRRYREKLILKPEIPHQLREYEHLLESYGLGYLLKEFPYLADYRNITSYIDPGFQHAVGFIIVGRDMQGNVVELFAKEWYGGDITEEDLKLIIGILCHAFHVERLLVENNSGGLWWADHFMRMGINTETTGFGTANPRTGDTTNAVKHLERGYYERVLKDLLEKLKLYLHSEKLKEEWNFYDLSHKNKEEGKGDLMDCLLQAAYYAVGGWEYLEEIAAQAQGDAYDDTPAFVG